MIPPIWADAPAVFVVGGGPSLRGFDFDALPGDRTIAINRSLEALPAARVLWWSDWRFFRNNEAAILAHGAEHKATARRDKDPWGYPPGVTTYRFTGRDGFDPDAACLRHGNNGGYAALHLAVHLGARRIVLLGIDLAHGADGATHWHDGHGYLHRERTLTDKMQPYFGSLVQPLMERGVVVLNASPTGRLPWPTISHADAIRIARQA